MRAWITPALAGFFFVCVFLVVLAPASLLLSVLEGKKLWGHEVRVVASNGSVWNGNAILLFQQHLFELEWQMSGLARADIHIASQENEISAHRLGWWWGAYHCDVLEISTPASLLSLAMPQVRAEGRLEGQLSGITLSQRLVSGEGRLQYTGGRVLWEGARPGQAELPSIVVTLAEEDGRLSGVALAETGEALAALVVEPAHINMKVYRRAATLLGGSGKGDPAGTVFEWSAPAAW